MCIGSICGLNIDENILVYEQLQKGVLEMGCETFILGGDWNRTWDTNIDVLDMAAIPSKLRSEKLKKMCETLKITDPYQVLYPNKLEYTYIPAALHHTNRSRIDFFCVSTAVINNIQNWTINNALSSTNFNHKGILLDFRKKVNFRKKHANKKQQYKKRTSEGISTCSCSQMLHTPQFNRQNPYTSKKN